MKNTIILLFVTLGILNYSSAQKEVKTFIFGHSLIHHEVQAIPTPSQETSVPHWVHFLAQEANHQYAVSGQYGFLPTHANLPPSAQWWFEYVDSAWDSENESFIDAEFTDILITPGNFIQWQPSTTNYPSEDISPIDATISIFDWCIEQDDSLVIYIYENWPEMDPFLNNEFPPTTSSEWDDYNDYVNGGFHDWFLEYHDILVDHYPNACINMIPVGPIISKVLQQAPFEEIEISNLYEDGAPHGRPTIYFLASLVTYMAMYEEKAPSSYEVTSFIDPIIADNYQLTVDIIWEELLAFNYDNGESRVFCKDPIIDAVEQISDLEVTIQPNPTFGHIELIGDFDRHFINVISMEDGKSVFSCQVGSEICSIDLSSVQSGLYLIVGKNESQEIIYRNKVVKL